MGSVRGELPLARIASTISHPPSILLRTFLFASTTSELRGTRLGPSTLAVSLSRCCSPYTLKYSSLRDPSAVGTMPGPSTLAVSLSTCSSPYAAANSSRWLASALGTSSGPMPLRVALPACLRPCAPSTLAGASKHSCRCAAPSRNDTITRLGRPSRSGRRPAAARGGPSSLARGRREATGSPPPTLPFRPLAFPDRQPADCISDGSSELIPMD